MSCRPEMCRLSQFRRFVHYFPVLKVATHKKEQNLTRRMKWEKSTAQTQTQQKKKWTSVLHRRKGENKISTGYTHKTNWQIKKSNCELFVRNRMARNANGANKTSCMVTLTHTHTWIVSRKRKMWLSLPSNLLRFQTAPLHGCLTIALGIQEQEPKTLNNLETTISIVFQWMTVHIKMNRRAILLKTFWLKADVMVLGEGFGNKIVRGRNATHN